MNDKVERRKTAIHNLMVKQQYDQYVVTDIARFVWCVANTDKGEAAKARFAEDSKNSSMRPQFLQYSKDFTSKTFFNHVRRLDEAETKRAECSNFAYHAIGVLLKPGNKIIKRYNVCLVGIMGGQHNIVVLLPKDKIALSEYDKQQGLLPEGALIIDPWAVGMGYEPDYALAVSQDYYAYQQSLPGMVIHYQSNNDATLYEKLGDFSSMNSLKGKMTEVHRFLSELQCDGFLESYRDQIITLPIDRDSEDYQAMVGLYNQLIKLRNDFIEEETLTEQITQKFETDFSHIVARLMEKADQVIALIKANDETSPENLFDTSEVPPLGRRLGLFDEPPLREDSSSDQRLLLFNKALQQFKVKVDGLETRGYPKAHAAGMDIYQQYVAAQEKLIREGLNSENIEAFKNEVRQISADGENGELGEFRGFKAIFKHIANVVVRVFTLNSKHLNSDSVDKIIAVKQAVMDLNEPSEPGDEPQSSSSLPHNG